MVQRFGLQVHLFDPTPEALEWLRSQSLPPGAHVLPYGLADYDGEAVFHSKEDPRNPNWSMAWQPSAAPHTATCQVRRLTTLMQMLGHRELEILKMDIEGMEYRALKDILAQDVPIRQMVMEFHHRLPMFGRESTEEAIRLLNEKGYRIFHVSATEPEYSFIRS